MRSPPVAVEEWNDYTRGEIGKGQGIAAMGEGIRCTRRDFSTPILSGFDLERAALAGMACSAYGPGTTFCHAPALPSRETGLRTGTGSVCCPVGLSYG